MLENIVPMQPILKNINLDDLDFIYQLKWDGVRMVSYIEANNINLINRRLNERNKQYPELKILPQLLKSSNAILDGEIVTLVNGKPSFPSIMRRDNVTNNKQIELLTRKIPIIYIVFDILYLNGEDLRNIPWQNRHNILTNTIKPNHNVQIIENFHNGSNLFTAIKLQGLEGIVAKAKNSPYISGKNHKYWFKIKYRPRISCVVGGFTFNNNIVNALLLGVYEGNNLIYCGKVGTGLKSSEWLTLTKELTKIEINKSPFNSLPLGVEKTAHFINPYLTVEVEYAEWTSDIKLRSPVIISFSSKKPEECILI